MAIKRFGQCVCGAVRYVCVGEPKRVTICHCLWCQRRGVLPNSSVDTDRGKRYFNLDRDAMEPCR